MTKTTAIIITAVITLVVGIGGTYVYMNSQNDDEVARLNREMTQLRSQDQSCEVTATTTNTTTTTSATDKTADWKTYTNDEYGFSLQIPSDYSIQEEQSYEGARGVHIRFGENIAPGVSDYNWVELTYLLRDDDLNYLNDNFVASGDISDSSDITVDGQDAISYSLSGFATGKAVISTNGKASLEIKAYPSNNTNIDFMDKVVDSFKF